MAAFVSTPRSAPPQWENVPFAVGCARCGQDLRGRSEPVCPACGLEFDWAEAVPIDRLTCLACGYHLYGLQDSRCPECGTAFTWLAVLDDYRRRRKPLFEYRWREAPIRSFVRTWFRSLRPGKFWRSIDIHDPPRLRPLLVVVIVALMLCAAALPVHNGVSRCLSDWLWWRWWQRWNWQQSVVRFVEDLSTDVLMAAGSTAAYIPAMFTAAWCGLTLAALMVFRQSMRRCMVRTAHVVRIWAYCIPVVLPLLVIGGGALSYVDLLLRWAPYRGFTAPLNEQLELGLFAFFIIYTVWWIRQAYRWYLRMPHSLGVAIAAQAIALLATLTCALLVLL